VFIARKLRSCTLPPFAAASYAHCSAKTIEAVYHARDTVEIGVQARAEAGKDGSMAGGLRHLFRQVFSQDPDGSLKRMITKDTSRRWTYAPETPVCTYHFGLLEAPAANGAQETGTPCKNAGVYVLWGTDPHVPLAAACEQHVEAVRARLEPRFPNVEVEPFRGRAPAA
jgi:hypothetical protein